ncbi:hypothetical protein SD78_1613 [Bacillus badius]|nr:hypothetical protein SD78_1613 [Bacillus badius]
MGSALFIEMSKFRHTIPLFIRYFSVKELFDCNMRGERNGINAVYEY